MAVRIRGKTLPLPIIQGGMGVGVSLDGLAGAVAAQGGMGTISAALSGLHAPDFEQDPKGVTLRELEHQIRRAREKAKEGGGLIAVNVMAATTQYAQCVTTALKSSVDAVVCGAGLPRDLPGLAEKAGNTDAALAPIVSSGRAAGLICKLWDRHYNRVPDFVVLEGPLAGGHLGFSHREAAAAQAGDPTPLSVLLEEVLTALTPFREKYGRDIPVFVAGGVKDGREMADYMRQGAAGAQFATRFITTLECDASPAYKEALLRAKTGDITIVKSPVGMPGRALRSPLIQRVEAGLQPKIDRCSRCLTPCDPAKSPYCISRALIDAVRGDWENGLFFCGANGGIKKKLTTVKGEIEQIMREWRNAQ